MVLVYSLTPPPRPPQTRTLIGPVRYTAADLLEKNRGGIGQNLLDLLDDACTNDLVGEGSRSSRYRSVGRWLIVVASFWFVA